MTQATIKDLALLYKPKTAKNITELKSIDVNTLVGVEIGTDLAGEEFTYNYIEYNGERYRLPDSVLSQLKAILEKKPTLRSYSVSKSGEGRLTRYQVIPLD